MSQSMPMHFVVDRSNKKIRVEREFASTIEQVWAAWTESNLLDQWWAPYPWRAQTRTMEFREGGSWLYAMVGPEQARHWSRVDFLKIVVQKYFEVESYFCDEAGKKNPDLPVMRWRNDFRISPTGTTVIIEILFDSETDIEQITAMGFEAGFTSALGNLDQYLEAQFLLRSQNKTTTGSRTNTYLNFPGNTEEAFIFYQSVFHTEFVGKGIQRFGDIPEEAGRPPVAENIKKMVLHVELPIVGGHVLMGTDAPRELGFNLVMGNNMHICLEPDTRELTKEYFDALSEGGSITMPLEDMFFGSYFGGCIDRFGINWMFNCIVKK